MSRYTPPDVNGGFWFGFKYFHGHLKIGNSRWAADSCACKNLKTRARRPAWKLPFMAQMCVQKSTAKSPAQERIHHQRCFHFLIWPTHSHSVYSVQTCTVWPCGRTSKQPKFQGMKFMFFYSWRCAHIYHPKHRENRGRSTDRKRCQKNNIRSLLALSLKRKYCVSMSLWLWASVLFFSDEPLKAMTPTRRSWKHL